MAEAEQETKKPVAVLVIGMAGSGKTTFMQRISSYLGEKGKRSYLVNLDPAVTNVPFESNVDIRDTVNYKKVMEEYQLGPNGGIVTALNLFTTRFDQLMDLMEKRSKELDYILIDTPGQIEIFSWSASGSIITEALASSYPTVVLYIIDTPRSASPATFMSNMLYACSILYRTQLPFVMVFNKTDVVSSEMALTWMKDFDAFQAALEQDTSYMTSLIHSMCLVLEEFYNNLRSVGVSSLTGEGMTPLFERVSEAAQEYEKDYLPILQERQRQVERINADKKKVSLNNLLKDMSLEQK